MTLPKMKTSVIVHESCVDTARKKWDVIRQLYLRLQRRDEDIILWYCEPVPIRDTWRRAGDGQMFLVQVGVMHGQKA